jgi:hypothetical protein
VERLYWRGGPPTSYARSPPRPSSSCRSCRGARRQAEVRWIEGNGAPKLDGGG